jgi:hypothetical protein
MGTGKVFIIGGRSRILTEKQRPPELILGELLVIIVPQFE